MAADTPPLLLRLSRLASHPLVRVLPVVAVGLVAVVALHLIARHVHWADVRADIAAASPLSLALAVLATAISYIALSGYDVLAVRSLAPGRVPLSVAALAGASGYAVSNLLGLSWLTGTAVRYRIYAAAGFDLALVAGVIATSWIGFWMAATLIIGTVLVLQPAGAAATLPIGSAWSTTLGTALLAALAALLIWLSRKPRALRFGPASHTLPDLRLSLGLMAVAIVDIGAAAATLYILLPADVVPHFAVFFCLYVGAVSLGILSHAPGGLGVFEAAMVAGLAATGRSDVLAALLLYRLVYTALPFAIACTCLCAGWLIGQRRQITRKARKTASLAYTVAKPVIPLVAAAIALLSGLILLVSGNLPSDPARIDLLRGVLPLAFVEVSHLAASVAGVLLIAVSRGLYRRLAAAWAMAMVLLGIGLATSLTRGLDWKEALSLALSLAVLATFRVAFYRTRGAQPFRLDAVWLASLVVLLVAAFWIGLFAYKHVDYAQDLWWHVAWNGDASRFLRTSLAVAVAAMAVAFASLAGGRSRRQPPQPVPRAVLDLLAASPMPEAQIALSGDKAFFLTEDARAFIAYADTGRSLVAKGDPVGDPAAARQAIWDLRDQADRLGRRTVFYAVSAAHLPTYLDLGLSILKIGEVGRVPLRDFTLEGSAKRDFRQAVNKAQREGYDFEILPRTAVPLAFPALKAVSDAWLKAKNGQEKAFSLGACTPDYLRHFDHAVLREPSSGRIVAFANLMQGADHAELSLDLMRYDPAAPRFVMDALFGNLMLWGKTQGFAWFSLGAAPLAGLENRPHAALWNRIGGFLFDHGEHFYHFEGLRSFKQKFDPVWTPEYLACPGGLAVPQVLYEINGLISGGVTAMLPTGNR